jgi:hypothetical protein
LTLCVVPLIFAEAIPTNLHHPTLRTFEVGSDKPLLVSSAFVDLLLLGARLAR